MRIRELRLLRGWSQAELARRAGLRTATLSEIETGRRRPRQGSLKQIAAALGVPAGTLLDVDSERGAALAQQLAPWRARWSHHSTALEGNTLSFSEAQRVLQTGDAIAGKSVRDQAELLAHGRAVSALLPLMDRPVTETDLHALHRQLMAADAVDVFAPHGAYKREPNGTHVQGGGWHEYAAPAAVPDLMRRWLQVLEASRTGGDALAVSTFLHVTFLAVHPYADGNGRLARLVSNLPVLRAGMPPVVVPVEDRDRYLAALVDIDVSDGGPAADRWPWPTVTDGATKLHPGQSRRRAWKAFSALAKSWHDPVGAQ